MQKTNAVSLTDTQRQELKRVSRSGKGSARRVVRALETLYPEARCALHHADPYQLLLLKKPLQIEAHKGGPALHKGGDGENCIVSWLKDKTDKAACTASAKLP